MANPAPTINQINAFNATQGTTIDFNIIGGTELVRSNRIYIYDLSDNSLICTHLYVSTESIHELPPNTDGSIVYESGKSSADFVNGAQYYAQIQTFTDIAGTQGGSGLSVSKLFWCLVDPSLTIATIPSSISTTSYNVSATYDANTSVVSNIIQQYQFSLYSATGSLLQSSGVVVGNGEQQGTSTAYDISYNFSGLSVGSSYYVVVDVTTTQGMSVNAQSSTFTVSIDTPTLGEATVVNNACDGYISVTSNLSSEYGGSGSGEIVSFETDSENVFTKLQVAIEPTQTGSGTPSPSNVRPIYGVGGVDVENTGVNVWDEEWVVGNYTSTGGIGVAINQIRSKNKIKVLPSATYYVRFDTTGGATMNNICFFDADENFVSATYRATNGTLTIPSNVHYIVFNMNVSYGTTYKNDISINYPSTDHDYHAYDGQTISQEFDVSLTPTSKDTDPYLFKAVGDIYGDRLEEELVGGTVNWNQLVQNGNFADNGNGWSYGQGTVTFANNECLLTATERYSQIYRSGASVVKDHKYLVAFDGKKSGTSKQVIVNVASSSIYLVFTLGESYSRMAKIANASATATGIFLMNTSNATSGDVTGLKNVAMFDLTAMFGSTIADYVYSLEQATAGSGIAWLKSYGFFTKPYYDYDTGTLKSVNPTAHVTRGVNAWDEEYRLGFITAAGVWVDNLSGYFSSKNPIQVLPNTEYNVTILSGGNNSVYYSYYDASGVFIERQTLNLSSGKRILTTPSNAHYMNFSTEAFYGTTYKNNICINISNSEVNGKYFSYEEHTYDLGNVPLYGVFQLENNKLKAYGDVRHAVGGTDRKFTKLVLDGTSGQFSEVSQVETADGTLYVAYIPSYVSGHKFDGYAICDDYVWADMALKNLHKGEFDTRGSYIRFVIADQTITTLSAWNAYLASHPITIVYEKATTTTEQTDPFEQIQEVSKYGTLEYITTNDVPVGHNTTYLTRDIFGGTLDLVSGRLVVTHKTILLDGTEDLWTEYPSYETQICYLRDVFEGAIPKKILQPNWGISNYMQCVTNILSGTITAGQMSNSTANSRKNLYMTYVSGITTLSAWKTYLATHPLQLCYELATPLTYQLTPQQINTLVGVNNVWSEQGNVELSYHIPITNLLVKRQDVDDVSGNWLTLYSQPIEQASDMDFTFIDFLNQYGKTYKYALVPLLTQTQSGVEVEVEGGYTVSDEVQSIFDGVFISDSTGSQKCKANVGYGNVNMNQSVGSITPIGSQYPIIVTNSNNRYHNGSISGMIVPDDYYYNGNLSRIDMVNKRNELEQFLTNKRAKIIKDWNSNIWLVMIMDNIDCSFDNNYGMGIVTFNANWLEIGDPTNQEDLQATGLVDVGGV